MAQYPELPLPHDAIGTATILGQLQAAEVFEYLKYFYIKNGLQPVNPRDPIIDAVARAIDVTMMATDTHCRPMKKLANLKRNKKRYPHN